MQAAQCGFPWPPGQEAPDDARVQAIAAAAQALVTQRDAWLNPPGLSEAELKKRTLTNLYNERPAWLAAAHVRLDAAVFAAYGWPDDLSDKEMLARRLALNGERGQGQGCKRRGEGRNAAAHSSFIVSLTGWVAGDVPAPRRVRCTGQRMMRQPSGLSTIIVGYRRGMNA